MRRAVLAVASLFAALTAPEPARAATLSAILRSPEGAALPGVVVTAVGPQGRHSTVTGPDGGCALELAPGAYTLAVDIPGFVVSQPSVTLGDDETRLSLVLAPAQGGMRHVGHGSRLDRDGGRKDADAGMHARPSRVRTGGLGRDRRQGSNGVTERGESGEHARGGDGPPTPVWWQRSDEQHVQHVVLHGAPGCRQAAWDRGPT